MYVITTHSGLIKTSTLVASTKQEAMKIGLAQAKGYGTAADKVIVWRESSEPGFIPVEIAMWRRDPNGSGTRWYRAEI